MKQILQEYTNIELAYIFEAIEYVLKYTDFKVTAQHIFNMYKKLTGATAGYIALLDEKGEENELLFLDSGGLECTD